MIIWLNGTFGVGKTTVAGHLVEALPEARVFDAEEIGFLLRRVGGLPALGDFQHWPPWRALVAETAHQVLSYVGGTLIVPQTVLVETYWREISNRLADAGITVHHYVLHAQPEVLQRRIESDSESNRAWRLKHLDDYEAALPWLRQAGQLIDTTAQNAEGAADSIRATPQLAVYVRTQSHDRNKHAAQGRYRSGL